MASFTYHTYKIKPFGHDYPGYEKNSDIAEGLGKEPCAICGRALKKPSEAAQAVVINGGDTWAPNAKEADPRTCTEEAGYMGVCFIGPTCHKRHLLSSFTVEYTEVTV